MNENLQTTRPPRPHPVAAEKPTHISITSVTYFPSALSRSSAHLRFYLLPRQRANQPGHQTTEQQRPDRRPRENGHPILPQRSVPFHAPAAPLTTTPDLLPAAHPRQHPALPPRAGALATTQLDSLISTPPSLATLALLFVVFFLSLKLLDLLWRTLVFWLALALRAIVLAGALALGLWVWARGLEGVVEDCEGLSRGTGPPSTGGTRTGRGSSSRRIRARGRAGMGRRGGRRRGGERMLRSVSMLWRAVVCIEQGFESALDVVCRWDWTCIEWRRSRCSFDYAHSLEKTRALRLKVLNIVGEPFGRSSLRAQTTLKNWDKYMHKIAPSSLQILIH